MIPIRDNIPANHFPMVNLWLIIVNALCFFYELQLGSSLPQFFMHYGFIPARLLGTMANVHQNADTSALVTTFTSMFLHGNLIHLISNMWMLWIFGDNVEDSMGHGRYLLFYLLCGIAAVILQTVVWPDSTTPMIGASGAISGILGAYFLLYPKARILTLLPVFIFFYFVEIPAFFFLGLWFVMQFLQGSAQWLSVNSAAKGGIAWFAHIGGFAAGFILVSFFRNDNRITRFPWRKDTTVQDRS
jgi:membrane associated rhomboid family serine protease